MLDQTRRRVTDRPVRNYYLNPNDAARYLSHSIIKYKGSPCYVVVDGHEDEDGEPNYRVHVYSPGGKTRIGIVDLDDPDLDLSSPSIGYANILSKDQNKLDVVFCMRHPYQTWKQGLSPNNCTFYNIDGEMKHYFEGFNQPGFLDSLHGIFPSFQDAVKSLREGVLTEVAISQSIAFQRRPSGIISAYHKTKEFGHVPLEIDQDGPVILAANTMANLIIRKNNPEATILIEESGMKNVSKE